MFSVWACSNVSGDQQLFCTWLNREAVLTFASEHRIAREFLPWFGDNLYRFTSYMGNAGYAPILRPRSKAEGSVNAIYRLADVMTEFHLERDPTRFRDPQLDEVWQKLRQLGGRLPPYLQFPRELPVVGQLVANPKGTVAFQLTYDPAKRVITMEGKRQAAAVSLTVSVSNNVELKREEVETAFKSLC